ncbi:peroxide-responsive transcriptional repressor PerR [Desulfatiferula olefinivorans]
MNEPSIAEELLQHAGLRPTPARLTILSCLIGSGVHPTTDELAMMLRDTGKRLPTATLYQSLEKLSGAGLIIRFTGPDGQARYDANLSAHHHLICRACHRVVDVAIDIPLADLGLIDAETGKTIDGWTLENAAIELKGVCPACKHRT